MSARWLIRTALAVLAFAPLPAVGDTIVNLTQGADDSGWSATWADQAVSGVGISINVLSVDLPNDTVTIEIEKTFRGAYDPVYDTFPDAIITFAATSASPVSNIVIASETVHNQTGASWSQFKWRMGFVNPAHFQASAASDWDADPPFSTMTLLTGGGQGDRLIASGGVVGDNGSFTASGILRMEVAAPGAATFFVLKESAVPEPATLLLLASGLAAALRRRNR